MRLNNANRVIILQQQKMANRIGQIPRSIKFSENSIRNFVKGSSFLSGTHDIAQQNYHHDRIMPKTYNNFNINVPGFDFYNKNNLLLRACNAEDIQYIQKNPIIYQEDLVVLPEESRSMNNIKGHKNDKHPSPSKPKTSKDFYKSNQLSVNEQEEKKSKQAQLNQFLFNYRQQEQQKKKKRLKFLSEVETKLNNLEKETASIEQQKIKQYQQLNGILKIGSETRQFAHTSDMLGKVNTALYELQGEKTEIKSPKKISEEMGLLQINLAIEQHHKYNDALLDQIERVSKSKQKVRIKDNQMSPRKVSTKKQNKNNQNLKSFLSKTLKKNLQIPPKPSIGSKKLTSTLKQKI